MLWIGLVAGLILWQLVVLVVYFIWQEDEDKAIVAATGLPGVILLLYINIHKKLKYLYRHARYKGALLDLDNKPCYCDSIDVSDYIEVGFTLNVELRDKYKIEDGWDPKDCSWQGVPNLRYTPIKILKKEAAYKLPRYVKGDFKNDIEGND